MAWRHLTREEVRARLLRRRAKRQARRALRAGPPAAIGYGAGWAARCRAIRAAQADTCRRCTAVGPSFPVDHILPRRLWPTPDAANVPENLAVLCMSCHALKTSLIEPTLYGGDPSLLLYHLSILARTGPTPTPRMIGDALARARQHIMEG